MLVASLPAVEDIAVSRAPIAASDDIPIERFEFKQGLNIDRFTSTAREAETSLS